MGSIQKILCSDRAIIALFVLLLACGLYVQGHHGCAVAAALLPLMIPVNEAFVLIIGIDALVVDVMVLTTLNLTSTCFQAVLC